MAKRGRPRVEGTEFRERDGIWYAVYRDRDSGERRRRSTGCRSREDAEVEHAAWRLQHLRPEKAAAADCRLATVLAHYAKHAKSLRTARDAGRAIERIAAFYGGCTVADLTREAQDEFVARLRAEGLSDGYIRRIVAVLAAAVHMAKRDHVIADHPHIRRPPAGKSRVRWLRPDEARALLAEAQDPVLRRFVMIALHTGARSEAIFQLDWNRVDLGAMRVQFSDPAHPETTKRRATARITDALAEELRRVPMPARTGLVVGVASVKKSFRSACTRAGLGADVTPNTLRHTFASWAVQRGVPLIMVAKALGHGSTQMVERHYGHLAPDHLDAVAAAVADEFSTNFRPVDVSRSANKGLSA